MTRKQTYFFDVRQFQDGQFVTTHIRIWNEMPSICLHVLLELTWQGSNNIAYWYGMGVHVKVPDYSGLKESARLIQKLAKQFEGRAQPMEVIKWLCTLHGTEVVYDIDTHEYRLGTNNVDLTAPGARRATRVVA